MRISGVTFVRNGVRLDYPFRESIRGMLPLVDDLVVAVGDSDDGTRDAVVALAAQSGGKLRIVDTVWDPDSTSGGRVLAQQTDLALDAAHHDWCLVLQADEVLHEADAETIRRAFATAAADSRIEGLLFDYVHFYGAYDVVGTGRRWYRQEVRGVRRSSGARAWRDAQGFRSDGRKLGVLRVPATVYHYGWVRPPAVQRDRAAALNHWWSADKATPVVVPADWDYDPRVRVRHFEGTHPAVMRERVAAQDWRFEPDTRWWPFAKARPREAALLALEKGTGWRPGEYRNFRTVAKMARHAG